MSTLRFKHKHLTHTKSHNKKRVPHVTRMVWVNVLGANSWLWWPWWQSNNPFGNGSRVHPVPSMYGGTAYTSPYYNTLEEALQSAIDDGAANSRPISVISPSIQYNVGSAISVIKFASTWDTMDTAEKVYSFKCKPFGLVTKFPSNEWEYHPAANNRVYKAPQ